MAVFKLFSTLFLALILAACDGDSAATAIVLDDRGAAADRVDQSGLSGADPDQTGAQDPGAGVSAAGAATITDVVLITGQSNALGSQTTFDPALDQPVDRFYAYTNNGWQIANLAQVWDLGWHPARGLDGDPHNNFGFHFGKTIVSQRSDRVVGIILVTAPGEGIAHWDTDGFFYRKLRNKTLLALNDLPHKSMLDGILWHQGETDWSSSGSNDPDLEEFPPNDYYSNKLWALISSLRMENWFTADRPFICGETARSPINSRLNALNRDNDGWTACVPGAGLSTHDEEQVHFTAESLRQLGANYADVYLQMTR